MLPPLTKREIAKILKKHRGSQAEVAKRAGVKRPTVSVWLKYGTSAKVEKFANEVARELLAVEAEAKAAAGDVNGKSVRTAKEQDEIKNLPVKKATGQ